ncbi:GDSL-type esterase/lipase family protein [Nocardioides jiangxiensis]|uniref:GDSL-type esterase/lipase family protein n=1 Tax=Nocardioides jiangxiensis TaxID=3064524 RepID=A0ABT9AXD5_9ACTN|nr:GDSL-type esterase/lipase family protein [Nocardioides sp. WY-20]MDO7867201.1 GDSL-type esterase/lipase family protein [Nocardioides sp. WY-20]
MRRTVLAFALALVGSALATLGPSTVTPATGAALPSCSSSTWLSAWYAAPGDAVLSQPPLEQTFRIQVRPLAKGGVARYRFSNRFGTGPVTFGHVTVGVQRAGAAITPGTLHAVTFGGTARVTVPRGADVVSDPVRMSFARFQKLLVSVHVVGFPGPATQHGIAEQTTWQTAPLSGDHTSNLTGSGFVPLPLLKTAPTLPQSIPYLTGVDVLAPRSTGAVVTMGDSITDGTEAEVLPFVLSADNIDRFVSYPDQLANRIAAAGLPFSVANAAISGNMLLTNAVVPIFGPSGLSRFGRDALDRSGATTVILLEGINDIGQTYASRDALVAGYTKVITAAHERGMRILLGTLTPMAGTLQPPAYGPLGEPTRLAVNTWIRSQKLSDGVIDFDKAVRDPAQPSRILPAYDGGDHLHFSAAGYKAMAAAVPLSQLKRPVCS